MVRLDCMMKYSKIEQIGNRNLTLTTTKLSKDRKRSVACNQIGSYTHYLKISIKLSKHGLSYSLKFDSRSIVSPIDTEI